MRVRTALFDLPAPVFFDPRREFWDWLDTPGLRYRQIIDVGAGTGHLTDQLIARGYEAIGIDLFPRVNTSLNVQQADATKYEYDKDAYNEGAPVVLICRPCHDGFAEQAAMQAIKHCEASVYYIGLDSNLENDFPTDHYHMTLVAENVGHSGENIWLFGGKLAHLRSFIWFEGHWRERKNGKLYNERGGWCDDAGYEDARVQLAHDWHLLPELPPGVVVTDDARVYGPDHDTGWLDRKGRLIGCDSHQHDWTAHHVCHVPVGRLEKLGLVRAYGPSSNFLLAYDGDTRKKIWHKGLNYEGRITSKQRRWLKAHGYMVDRRD